MKQYNRSNIDVFRDDVYKYYDVSGRHELPWRHTDEPWQVLVSEVMLQQTQVDRVREKYLEFFSAFPNLEDLAEAPVSDLLAVWKGLGYNRRALNLQRAAQMIIEKFGGQVPEDHSNLVELPGIGPATASAIRTYAFKQPEVYIETNIRAVFIHHFFGGRSDIHDDEIRPLVEHALDRDRPFHWYSALMDYGTALKKQYGNPARRSKHYVRQSKFEGSNRQQRSWILSAVMDGGGMTVAALAKVIDGDNESIAQNCDAMVSEGFLIKDKRTYRIK